ncbi:hypothetical protein D4Q76_03040 [archaeon]|nr:MAG: hypothetical protein D4Q76_03040 [archaeon]
MTDKKSKDFFDILFNRIEPKYGSNGISSNVNTKPCKAVIEGTFHDEVCKYHLKLASLIIPEGVSVVDDGVYKYRILGRAADFKEIKEVKYEGDKQTNIKPLIFAGNAVLEKPRMFCLETGEIFVEETIGVLSKNYLSNIVPFVMQNAGRIFRETDEKEFIE